LQVINVIFLAVEVNFETLVGAVGADVLDGIADDFLVVGVGLGGDPTEDHTT
jgi:hypothetical protein